MDNEKIESKKDWSKEILDFYNSEEYQKLNEYYNRSTIFDALGIQRSETIHSKFLKWLLDPDSNHQLSDIPLRKFLRLLSTKNIDEQLKSLFLSNKPKITIDEIETERISYKLNKDSYGRIDLFISLKIGDDDVAIVVENKIKAKERDTIDISNDDTAITYYEKKYGKTDINTLKKVGQTVLYQFWLEEQSDDFKDNNIKKIYMYLTPDGNKCQSDAFVCITYQEIVDSVIDPIMSLNLTSDISFFIKEYLRTLSKPSENDDNTTNETEYNKRNKNGKITIIATSNYEKNLLQKLWDNHNNIIKNAAEIKMSTDDETKDEQLYNFWNDNESILLSVLKERNYIDEYNTIANKTVRSIKSIFYNGHTYNKFSKFVWKIISDYVENEKIENIKQLRDIFENKNVGTCNTRMFAAENEYESFRAERPNYWFLKEPITLKSGEKIYVNSTWENRRNASKNHNQHFFLEKIKKVGYKVDIE